MLSFFRILALSLALSWPAKAQPVDAGDFVSLPKSASSLVVVARSPQRVTVSVYTKGGPFHRNQALNHGFLIGMKSSSDGRVTVAAFDVREQPSVEVLSGEVRIQAYSRVRDDRFEFRAVPLRQVLERVSARLEMRYLLSPDAKGTLTGCIEGPQPLRALSPLLARHGLQMRVSEHFITVGSASQMARITPHLEEGVYRYGGFQQILLEHKQAKDLLHQLRHRYPRVQFDLHPTMNGFYVKGSRKSILQLKSDVPSFDK